MKKYCCVLFLAILMIEVTNAQTVTWTQMANAPTPFFEAGGGVLGNYLYCFGADASLNAVAQAFNLTTEQWETSTRPPFGQRLYASAVTNDAIYLITWMGNGPWTYGPDVQKFTPTGGGPTGTWTQLAPYPLNVIVPAVAWDGGNFIYAAGGQDPNPYVGSFKYNLALNTWTPIADLPLGRGYGGGGAFIQGKFYDLGGVFPPDLLEYDPGNNTWTFKASPPSPVFFGGLCTTTNGNLLFSAGGGGWFMPLYNAVQIYNPLTNNWILETPLPMLIGTNFARFVPPNKIISAGGTDGGQYLAVTYLGVGFPTGSPAVAVTLTPINPPITIPASGGSFSYNATFNNLGASPTTFDAWIMVQLPSTTWYGPALGPLGLTLPGSASLTRLRTQSVPENAPEGDYWYEARVGSYPSAIWDTSGFAFTKLGTNRDWLGAEGWVSSGGSFNVGAQRVEDPLAAAPASGSEATPTMEVMPNPFNPTTVLSFELRDASFVKLSVYDLSGRRVTTLVDGWREAGSHELTFDGSGLPSGVYLMRLEAGNFRAAQKLILLK